MCELREVVQHLCQLQIGVFRNRSGLVVHLFATVERARPRNYSSTRVLFITNSSRSEHDLWLNPPSSLGISRAN
jgi:hypothetical protein